MRYVISDIHGCYNEYAELLRRIGFAGEDELYVLGDAVDRGPEPVKVLLDLMARPNVCFILGNHDYVALKVLKKFGVEITEENVENHLTIEDVQDYMFWMKDGGEVTAKQFGKLDRKLRADILEFIENASVYEVLEVKGTQFVLAHAGICDFDENKPLWEYDFVDFVVGRADYTRRYFSDPNTILVTGHTPTPTIRKDKKALIYEENGHLVLDCGCVFGGQLAAYCLETGEVTYVRASKSTSNL